jgi:hypothetical protein
VAVDGVTVIAAEVAPVDHSTLPSQLETFKVTEPLLQTVSVEAVMVGGVWLSTVITASFDGLLAQPFTVQIAV